MILNIRGKIKKYCIYKKNLKPKLGKNWFLFLIICLLKSRYIFNDTKWSKMKDNESKFAERLSITVSLYQNLIKKFGKKTAYDITCDIIINIGLLEQIKNFESLRVDDKEPMEQLLAFYGFMGVDGVGKYVKRILIEANQNILHYEVRNCYFNRFYKALEVPELTKLFCEIDKKFFQIFSLISSFIGVILLKILKHMEKNSVYFYLREK